MKTPDQDQAPNGRGHMTLRSGDLLGRLRGHITAMAPHQKERHAGRLLIEATDALGSEIIARATALSFLVNNIEEIKNQIGGVIGYRLQLNDEDTETLWRILDKTAPLNRGVGNDQRATRCRNVPSPAQGLQETKTLRPAC